MKNEIHGIALALLFTASLACASGPICTTVLTPRERAMAPGMWHRIRNGEPIADASVREGAYLVLDNDGKGKVSFQIALVKGDNVLQSLVNFQKVTGITSGKAVANFNVRDIELDQWSQPTSGDPSNHIPNQIQNSREGLMVCLFSGAIRGSAPGTFPPPHCHVIVAGLDHLDSGSKLSGGFPATGGHLGAATVHVVFEMHVDSYPAVIEKRSGGAELGGLVIGISDEQAEAARRLLERDLAPAPAQTDFVLISTVKFKPDQVQAYRDLLLPYIALTRKEEGNANYFAQQSTDDPTEFAMYEHWKSDAARAAHLAAPYTVEFFKGIGPMLEPGYPIRKKYIEVR